MSTQKRRLAFYFLTIIAKDDDENEINAFSEERLKEFCDYIATLGSTSRMLNIPQSNKTVDLCSLELYKKQNKKYVKGLILAGKYNHCPDYLSKETGTIRKTDKQMDEAFAEKTHFIGQVKSDGIELLFESRQSGASIGMVVKCLDKIWNNMPDHHGYFHYTPIAIDNLEEAVKKLQRIQIGNIYFDKTYFTDDGKILGNMKSTKSLQDDIVLTLKAKRAQTINKSSMADVLRTVGSARSQITRIRLEGKSEDGNTIIDTLLTKRVNNVSVQLDKQGLVDDASIYKKMEGIFESDE